ncbi:hypothetical protein QNO07_13985 [Streptomyces sp. 549]|uniref:hypothetical protein n=1 Tax=Streptomyces sp. 549 TaxID=3049076 RepID=UPI0024C2871C|nr:hypothetical protein [Streptomyces sp. 549]MDK1474515.1 hypothetical protein [Streptomyces sp. 549]
MRHTTAAVLLAGLSLTAATGCLAVSERAHPADGSGPPAGPSAPPRRAAAPEPALTEAAPREGVSRPFRQPAAAAPPRPRTERPTRPPVPAPPPERTDGTRRTAPAAAPSGEVPTPAASRAPARRAQPAPPGGDACRIAGELGGWRPGSTEDRYCRELYGS